MNVSSAMFVVAVKFMAPIVAVILFIRVSFGIIARMIPQMSFIFAIGFAVTILLGLLTLRLLLPDMVRILERMFSDLGGDIHAVIAVLH